MARRKKCELCGTEFLTNYAQKRYCSDACRAEAKRTQSLHYKEQKKKKKKESSFVEINRKAREAGMSYGKYVAMLHMEEMNEQSIKSTM